MRLLGKVLVVLCLLLPTIARAQTSIPVAPALTAPNAGGGGGGGVTVVNPGTGISISGSPTTPVVNLSNTAVLPGSYTSINGTVDAQGRLTSATNGSGVAGGCDVNGIDKDGKYNVKCAPFNAKGDATTDDTAAIQAAVTASCAAGTNKPLVYLPPTPGALCYKTTSPLLLNCSTAFTGPQASLNGAAYICQNHLGPTIIAQGQEANWTPPLAASVTATWQATHAYTQYKEIIDSNGNLQFVKTAGTSGGSVPTWATTQGSTTTDGTVTWQMAMGSTLQLATGTGSALDTLSPEFFPGAGYGGNNGYVEINHDGKIDTFANGASAFTIEFYANNIGIAPGVQDVNLFAVSPGQPMPNNLYAARIYVGAFNTGGACTINCLGFTADIGGSSVSASSTLAAGIYTAGVTHHLALTYDGTTVRLFKDGTLVASAAGSGTWTVPAYENWMLGNPVNQCYQGCGFALGLQPAYYDSLRISQTARYTSGFAAPTAKFASDGNTIFLLNFPTTAPKGTLQAFNNRQNQNVFIPISTNYAGTAQLNSAYIGNLNLSGNGIWANWMINSTIENIGMYSGVGGDHETCVNLASNDYQDTVRRVLCATGFNDGTTRVGFLFGNQGNQNIYDHLQCDGQHSCVGQLTGQGWYLQPTFTDRVDAIYPYYFIQAQAKLEAPSTDIEDSPAACLGIIYSNGAFAPIVIEGGQLSTGGGTPCASYMAISGGQPFVDIGTMWAGTGPTQILNVISPPVQPVTIKDALLAAVPRTNASNGQYLSIQQNGKIEQSTVTNLWACGSVNNGAFVDITDCNGCTFGGTCAHSATPPTPLCPEQCDASDPITGWKAR